MDQRAIVRIASAPHGDTFGYAMPPPGLLRLGGWLKRAGWRVELDDLSHALARGDLPADDRLGALAAERLCVGAPWVLGLSTMGATLPIALHIAEEVKRRQPKVHILLGGPGTTGIDRAILERFPFVDAVVRGEGEQTAEALLGALSNRGSLDGVLGLTHRSGTRVVREPDRPPLADLSQLAPPAWELLPPLSEYKRITGEDEGLVPIDSGRGCVYDCSFCTIGRFWSRRSRPVPAELLVRDMEAALAQPAAKRVYLCHDLFGADRAHALALCAHLERRGPLPFEIRARIDHLDPELSAALGRAGCYRVLLGIETADGELRNRHGKRMAADIDLLPRLRALSAAGVTPILSLILGLPGEGEAGLRATLDLALRASLAGGMHISFHLVNPQPGCALSESHGSKSSPVADLPPDMALGAGTTAPERALIAAHPDLFSTFAVLTGEPGGVEHLRFLKRLANELAPLLERLPRTFAALAAQRGMDTLDLYRDLLAQRTDLVSAARAARHPVVDALLGWEQALLRAAARGGPAARGLGTAVGEGKPELPFPEGPRALAEVLELDVDAPSLALGLADLEPGAPLPPVESRPVHLAIQPGPRGVRTLRVSEGVARLLRAADGRDLEQLEATVPGARAALPTLLERGLIAPFGTGPGA